MTTSDHATENTNINTYMTQVLRFLIAVSFATFFFFLIVRTLPLEGHLQFCADQTFESVNLMSISTQYK
jgi:hypothetical protein